MLMKSLKLKPHWLHVTIWSIFIAYESIVVGLVFGVFGNPITYALHYTTIISYFYLLSLYGLPWAFTTKSTSVIKLPLILILMIGCYITVNFVIDKILVDIGAITHVDNINLDRSYVLKELYRCIYFTGFSTAFYFLRNYLKQRQKANDLETIRLENIIAEEKMQRSLSKAQNDFLRAQINPHFLFNSLNFVYHTILKDSELAQEAITILSETMRYAVETSHSQGLISLKDEVGQVNKFIRLNQLRKRQQQYFDIYMEEKAGKFLLIPLVVLTLAENIFKHGNLNDPELEALISIFTHEGRLYIQSRNKINQTRIVDGTNSGLRSISERLYHAFGKDADISYSSDTLKCFSVTISISIAVIDKPNI
jgi:sensor histidine kinase YesM